ncbi:CRISPR-associated protein Cas6 [Thermocrinis albus DSM 14484]|uniref:CRISPR-associated protein Cas6 n=1 Tax=Thermocrinis albus (strain DSM 14484 / JCM 11386 / HI 11/12) TaxID=638303 RepID=D3SNA6_THEAH|nr:CRISPR-associated endoribonuclease Cas6 [Thermocrinis albus]ADC88643.1 CRISPR-associated protein Cas6 [Thermocrinis albus DSM 14484]
MRFLVRLKPLKEQAVINVDYRRRFISLLKKILGTDYFESIKTKPYTFAVYMGKEAKFTQDKIEGVKTINLRFSTGDTMLAIRFYNGVLRFKRDNQKHLIGDTLFVIDLIREEKEKPITGVFKTLSPVVVERMGFTNSRDPEERYITPDEEGFQESFIENTLRRYYDVKGFPGNFGNFSLRVLEYKKEYVKHYGGVVKCFIGKFIVMSDNKEIQEFIYKYGAGLRTGQGFGYLEVEEWKS